MLELCADIRYVSPTNYDSPQPPAPGVPRYEGSAESPTKFRPDLPKGVTEEWNAPVFRPSHAFCRILI